MQGAAWNISTRAGGARRSLEYLNKGLREGVVPRWDRFDFDTTLELKEVIIRNASKHKQTNLKALPNHFGTLRNQLKSVENVPQTNIISLNWFHFPVEVS